MISINLSMISINVSMISINLSMISINLSVISINVSMISINLSMILINFSLISIYQLVYIACLRSRVYIRSRKPLTVALHQSGYSGPEHRVGLGVDMNTVTIVGPAIIRDVKSITSDLGNPSK